MSVRALLPLLLAALPGTSAPRSHAAPGVEDERLWRADVEVAGPLHELRVEAGAAGTTAVQLDLLPGETRVLSLPVPVRSPLGASALARVALPAIASLAEGSAKVRGWSADQPAAEIAALPAGLLARPSPPVSRAQRTASGGGLSLLVLALVTGLFLRRARAAVVLVGVVAAGAVVLVAITEGRRAVEVVLLEGDLERGLWLEVSSARGRIVGPFEAVASVPGDAPLALTLDLRAAGAGGEGARPAPVHVEAPGVVLVGRRLLRGARRDLVPERNGLGPFVRAWTRSPAGVWTARGAWPLASPLPAALPEGDPAGGAPPGWLAAGVAPGRGAVVGRLVDGRWVRAVGLPEAPESGETR